MEAFENQALHTFQLKTELWLRYVDDIWPHRSTTLDSMIILTRSTPESSSQREEEFEGKIAF